MSKRLAMILTVICLLCAAPHDSLAQRGKRGKKADSAKDPYADFVWPPPPAEARIKLERVISSRADVEGRSKLKKWLIGASPEEVYDRLRKPIAVEFDSQGRILVSDWQAGALIRYDREGSRMDVLGTRGSVRLKQPMGLDVGPDDLIYVADVSRRQVLTFDGEGRLIRLYGGGGELRNPTDAAVSPDGERLYVADSKAHDLKVFDLESAELLRTIGGRGVEEGQFGFPSALAFGLEGELYVVDQINARVQVFDSDEQFLDLFGQLGGGFGQFVRPKDIAVDELGLIYVTDYAFNNVQLFDIDFSLLTFVGTGGVGPGQFSGASGIAVRGREFAVVDQLGRRVQVFRFLRPAGG